MKTPRSKRGNAIPHSAKLSPEATTVLRARGKPSSLIYKIVEEWAQKQPEWPRRKVSVRPKPVVPPDR